MRKRIQLIFLVSLLAAVNTFAENRAKIDSLKKVLSFAETDSVKLSVLSELANEYFNTNPDTVTYYAEEILRLSKSAGNGYYQATALRLKAVALKGKGDFEKAAGCFIEALKWFEKHQNIKECGACYNGLGSVYIRLKDFSKAAGFFLLSIECAKKEGNEKNVASGYNNLGVFYAQQGKTDSASYCFNKSLNIRIKLGDKEGIASCYGNLGKISTMANRFDEALDYQKKSLAIREELNDVEGIANTQNNIGEVYLDMGSYSTSIGWFNKGLETARKAGLTLYMQYSYEAMTEAYEGMKDYEKALECFKKSAALQDSMMGSESKEHIEELMVKYETEKKDGQLKILNADNEFKEVVNSRRQRTIYIITGGLSLLVLLVFVLFQMYRQKEAANRKLKKLDEEKNEFLNLAANDLKTPLATIIGYCRMQADYFDKLNKEKILRYSDNIKSSATKMVDLIGNLLDVNAIEEGRVKNNPERIDLNKFFDDMFKEFEELAKEKNIRFEVEAEGGSYHVHADPRLLSTVTENLLNHSITHAAANGVIQVKLVKKKNKTGYEVADTGSKNSGNADNAVLGIGVLKRMLNIMQADLEINARGEQGAIFTVLLQES